MAEKILNIPYKSQHDADAQKSRNDCGATSLAMVLGYCGIKVTTDEVWAKTGAGSGYINFQQLKEVAKSYGFDSRYEKNKNPQRLKDLIDQGIPPIIVLHSGYLSSRQDKKFTGAHIMVVSGYRDDGWFVKDPNFWGKYRSHGDNHFYKKDEFELAWRKSTIDKNPASCLLCIINKEMSNTYKGLDLTNKESMKVCVDIWKDVVDRKYIKKEECDKIKEEEIKQLKEDFIKSSQEASVRLTELCNKSLKGKDIQYKNEIKDVLKNAKEDWKVIELQDKVREYEKICQTIAYKVAVAVAKILQALKIIKKEVKNG